MKFLVWTRGVGEVDTVEEKTEGKRRACEGEIRNKKGNTVTSVNHEILYFKKKFRSFAILGPFKMSHLYNHFLIKKNFF